MSDVALVPGLARVSVRVSARAVARGGAVACRQHGAAQRKNTAGSLGATAGARFDPFIGSGAQADVARDWFARALWRAFPGPSEAAVAKGAARRLGVSERQARNWLRCEHDASLRHVAAVIMVLGAGAVTPLVGSALVDARAAARR